MNVGPYGGEYRYIQIPTPAVSTAMSTSFASAFGMGSVCKVSTLDSPA